MKALMQTVLQISLYGGFAALGAWAACAVLRRLHAPERFLCWIWAAVGLRFVLPGGIPVFFTLPQTAAAEAAPAAQALSQWMADPALPLTELQNTPFTAPAAPSAVQAAVAQPGFTVWHAAAAIWALGVLAMLAQAVYSAYKLNRAVALACREADGCYGGPCVAQPFTMGVLRPKIYMPAGLAPELRGLILRHEKAHIKRRDPLAKTLAYGILCLHWFNPLAWLAFCQYERCMESACDEAAIRGQSEGVKNSYCEGILRFALHRPQTPPSLAFGQSSAKRRIVHLLQSQALGKRALALCVAFTALSCAACMAHPQFAPEKAQSMPVQSSSTAEETPEVPAGEETVQEAAVQQVGVPDLNNISEGARFYCPVEYESIKHADHGHTGDDLAAEAGTPVYAAAAGTVLNVMQQHFSYGKVITIQHEGGWLTRYAHLQDILVQEGQSVQLGEEIGTVGNTGYSTGYHLHFETYAPGAENIQRIEPGYVTAYPENDRLYLTAQQAAAVAQGDTSSLRMVWQTAPEESSPEESSSGAASQDVTADPSLEEP